VSAHIIRGGGGITSWREDIEGNGFVLSCCNLHGSIAIYVGLGMGMCDKYDVMEGLHD
jgi:hypothetical protein